MKVLSNTKGNSALSQGLVTSEMGISRENIDEKLKMVTAIFADGIYSNKILAPVRELITNAVDEHHKHCPNIPVRVEIKQEDGNYHWSVRDFALGLSEDGVRNVLGMLLESTKNTSNESMGGFGVGAKSFFAYTDSAMIYSYFEGVKTTYCAFKSGTEEPKLGKVCEEPTDQSGIEISFEILPSDVREFERYTESYIEDSRPETLIKFYNQGSLAEIYQPKYKKIAFDKFTYSFDPDQYYDNWSAPTAKIRMGDVVYPYPDDLGFNNRYYLSGYIDVPVGYLSLPIHREAINDNPINRRLIKEFFTQLKEKREEESKNLKVTLLDVAKRKPMSRDCFLWPKIECGRLILSSKGDNDNKVDDNIVVVIPNNRAKKTWTRRVESWASSQTKNIFHVYQKEEEDGSVDLGAVLNDIKSVVTQGNFEVKFVKDMKIPSLSSNGGAKKGPRTYVFRGDRYNKAVHYTVDGFDAHYKPKIGLDINKAKTTEEVYSMCVATGNAGYHWDRKCFYCCKGAFNELIKKGWNDLNSQPVKDRLKEIFEKESEIFEVERRIERIKKDRLLSDKTKTILSSKMDIKDLEEKSKLLEDAIESIKNKNDLTKIIFENLQTYRVNRSQLKQIIKKVSV